MHRSVQSPMVGPRMTTERLEPSSLFELYDQSDEIKRLVSDNIAVLKCIRGGLRMAQKHRLDFDPRTDYWRPPERRLLVAYLADRWTGRFAPPNDVRALTLQLTAWFDQARPEVVQYFGVDYDKVEGGLAKICGDLAAYARRMAATSVW